MKTNTSLLLLSGLVIFLACMEVHNKEIPSPANPAGTLLPPTNKIAPDEIPDEDFPVEEVTIENTVRKVPEKYTASPEMALLYDYLDMDTEQVARFEVYYHYHITQNRDEQTLITDQTELQRRMDSILKTILIPEQYARYITWKK